MSGDPASLAPGSTVGDWTLVRKLGEGSMGVVFEATNRNNKRAALKVVRPELLERPDHAARFRREGKLLRRLEHRNVVELIDVGEAEGLPFIALGFIEGESLAARLERGALPQDEAVRLARDVLRGLAAIHDAGILHRDLKPGNIMLAKGGDWKITDFGLARRENEESIVVTRMGAILGTPHYMAPEQCLGEPVDVRSDLYSVGALLYHALAGDTPFKGKRTMEVMQGHIADKAPDLAARVPGLPPELGTLVARLLEKKRDDRPESARAALIVLGNPEVLDLPPPPAPVTSPAAPAGATTTGATMTPARSQPRPTSSFPATATTPSRSQPRPEPAPPRRPSSPPTTQRRVLTPSGRIPGVVKASVVRRGRRIPWERATLPLAPAVLAALHYLAMTHLGRDELMGFAVPQGFLRPAFQAGAAVGLWRVFTGYFEVNAPPLSRVRWFYRRAFARLRAWVFRTARPRLAAQALRDLGAFSEAAEVLLAAGLDREAGAEFLKAGETERAAKIFERVNDAQAAVKAYSKLGDTRAAVVALEAKRFDEAARIFQKHKEFAAAADAWQRAGKPLEAATAFEAAQRHEDAANELTRALENAAGPLGQVGKDERHKWALKAADLFERAGAALGAAGRFEKLGELEVAQQLFAHGGDLAAAARVASGRGDHDGAADLYLRAGRPHEAAKERGLGLLARPGGFALTGAGGAPSDPAAVLSAAKSFEAAGEPRRAADLYAHAGDFASAARLYTQAQAWHDASLCYRELGDKEAATRALEQADPIGAAETWVSQGKPREALRLLGALPTSARSRSRASGLLGDAHLAAGERTLAAEAFSAAIGAATESDPEFREHLSEYARRLVGLGLLDRALEQVSLAKKRIGGSPEIDRVLEDLNVRRRTGRGGEDLLGCTVDRYKVQRLLGAGATAWVYEAEHTFLGRPVALKVLKPHPPDETDLAERFYAEARAVAKLRHRNVIQVYDVGATPGGLLYMALEIVRGDSLRKRIEGKLRIPPSEATRIVSGVLAALHAAHARGIVHRDLKPENILLGPGDVPKVVDFGIAKLAVSKVATMTGTFLGTPKYASPEQAQGKEASASSDLYAAGLVLYEMLAGRGPFESETPLGYLTKHATTAPTPLAALAATLPAPLVAAVMRSLEKDPGKRWPDADSFRKALAPFAGKAHAPARPPAKPPAPGPTAGPASAATAGGETIAMPGAVERLRLAATGVDLGAHAEDDESDEVKIARELEDGEGAGEETS